MVVVIRLSDKLYALPSDSDVLSWILFNHLSTNLLSVSWLSKYLYMNMISWMQYSADDIATMALLLSQNCLKSHLRASETS